MFRKKKQRPVLIPFFCDTHPNSTVGLVPEGGIALDDGGWYRQSPAQMHINDAYSTFWAEMAVLKKKLNAHCLVVFGGDGTDDNKYSKYQLATVNEAVIVKTALKTFEPALSVADALFYIRGTESHTRGSGALEELVAMNLKAEQSENGRYSRWYWEHEIYGVHTLFSHHPFSSSWVPWTKGSGAMRTAMAIEIEYLRAGKKVPEIAAFGHGHEYADSGENRLCRVYYSPGWSVAGAYVHRLGKGWMFNPLGALYFVIYPDGTWYGKKRTFRPRRPEPWLMTNLF